MEKPSRKRVREKEKERERELSSTQLTLIPRQSMSQLALTRADVQSFLMEMERLWHESRFAEVSMGCWVCRGQGQEQRDCT